MDIVQEKDSTDEKDWMSVPEKTLEVLRVGELGKEAPVSSSE